MVSPQGNKRVSSLDCFLPRAWFGVWAVLLVVIGGCGKSPPPSRETMSVHEVAVVCPTRTSLYWTVQQPGSIEAFEETPILPKIAGFVEQWNVDIGDRVIKGQSLAKLWVPELVADLHQKEAAVGRDESLIIQARQVLRAAEANVNRSEASLRQAEASRIRARAENERWRLQFQRDKSLLATRAISSQELEITTNQFRSSVSAQGETIAAVETSQAALIESKAQRDKALADIGVAEANLQVARADCDRAAALLAYARIEAPFDGVISRRNISRGNFVQPPSAAPQDPLYVVQRRDRMRIFVETPESDAVWVREGTSVRIRVPALENQAFAGTVARMSYSLKRQARTLLTEIDLPNPEDLLRPGMYAYATIQLERTNVLTLPDAAVATQGDVNEGYQDYCFVVENGKVRRTPVKLGSRGDGRVEVLKKQDQGEWKDFTGEEKIVQGELSVLTDGQEVRIAADLNQDEAFRTAQRNAIHGEK